MRELPGQVSEEDHGLSVSLYVADPDGNPYEITTYERSA
jgi:catechol-2,3-dioxygenase